MAIYNACTTPREFVEEGGGEGRGPKCNCGMPLSIRTALGKGPGHCGPSIEPRFRLNLALTLSKESGLRLH